MSRIDRYLLREIMVPLAVSVTVVVLLVFLFQVRRLAGAALGLGVTLGDIATIFVCALPPFLVLAVPIAYLLSVMAGLGRLGQDLELVALRAAGSSPWRIARVPLWGGVWVSLVCVPLAYWGEPAGLRWLRETLIDVGLRNLEQAIQPGVFSEDFRGSAVFAAQAKDGDLEDVLLYDERDRERSILVLAERGQLRSGAGRISFNLEAGEIHPGLTTSTTTYERLSFGQASLALDADGELLRRTKFVSPVGMMWSEELLRFANEAGEGPYARRLQKTYWRRFAFPLMAAVFAMVAAAISLSGGTRTRARNAILGLLAVVGYYVLTRLGDMAAVAWPHTPLLAAFGPNLAVLVLAGWGLARAGRPS